MVKLRGKFRRDCRIFGLSLSPPRIWQMIQDSTARTQ
jgi:hypothetical protein